VGCPEGCLELHFLDDTSPHVLRQANSSCENPSITAMDCVFHAEKHWRVYTGDSFGNITCWTATVIATMCDAFAFYQSIRKSKAIGMIGELSHAVTSGALSTNYKFTSILDIDDVINIPSHNSCKITCMVMDSRRDYLIIGDSLGMLRMFTNTMEELWSSAKHKCAVRCIAIALDEEKFASGDVRFKSSSTNHNLTLFA
jgi:hypothetical protein